MASEMVERVAAELWEAWRGAEGLGGAWPNVSKRSRQAGHRMATAAIRAMREPTEAMLEPAAAILVVAGHLPDVLIVSAHWRAMIDEALKEPPPAPAA